MKFYNSTKELEGLADIIIKDYPTYSGLVLEYYFKAKMIESREFRNIGSWWQGKSNKEQDEIKSCCLSMDDM